MVYNEKEKIDSKFDDVAEILPGKENVQYHAPSSSPAPPISYAVNQNLNASGNSHKPPSHSGMKPNSAANPPIQPTVHNHPPHTAAPSFSYNFPHSAAAFAGSQHAQSNTNMPDFVKQDFSKGSSASNSFICNDILEHMEKA